MKPCRIAGLCALTLLVGSAAEADAAWNNVFQVTCFGCSPQTSKYYAAPVLAQSSPCCAPQPTCCQPACTTRYIQRSYYQPVTVMQTQSYYEPVTTYRTSYYYEPVTTYRYSSYYDPCSGCPQQVATPCTSYELRSKSCPVQSWVQRCSQVPVTTYQKACYWEPQTTCCSTTVGAPVVAVPAAPAPAYVPQPAPAYAPQPAPAVNEQRYSTPPPPVTEQKTSNQQQYDRYYPPESGSTPQSLPRSLPPGTPKPATPPQVKLERIVAAPEARVEGQVVRKDAAPGSGAKVLFVNAQKQNTQQEVTANASGRFDLELPAGDWFVYVSGPDGRQVYHSRIAVGERAPSPLHLVSR